GRAGGQPRPIEGVEPGHLTREAQVDRDLAERFARQALRLHRDTAARARRRLGCDGVGIDGRILYFEGHYRIALARGKDGDAWSAPSEFARGERVALSHVAACKPGLEPGEPLRG